MPKGFTPTQKFRRYGAKIQRCLDRKEAGMEFYATDVIQEFDMNRDSYEEQLPASTFKELEKNIGLLA